MTKKNELTNDKNNGFTLSPDDGSVQRLSHTQSVNCAQQIIRKYVNKDTSLVDELIESRQVEE